jgi:hypothetical protein
MYSVRYYPRYHITDVGLGTYYPWIQRHICNTFYVRSVAIVLGVLDPVDVHLDSLQHFGPNTQ